MKKNVKFRIYGSNFHVFHMLRRILVTADFSRIRNASLARFTLDRTAVLTAHQMVGKQSGAGHRRSQRGDGDALEQRRLSRSVPSKPPGSASPAAKARAGDAAQSVSVSMSSAHRNPM